MRTLPPKLELMAPLTDAELVERIIGGDSGVFELLMRRHNQRLFRLARSVVRNSDEAEEIVQETYLRAYANLARFEGRSSVVTWLSRIAFHQALRPQRRKRQSRVTDGLDLDALQMSDTSPSENDSIARDELRTSLAAAMDSLPTSLRAIVMLRLVEGLSTRETAQSLRLSESNVKVGLHRGRRLLSETIERNAMPKLREAFSFGEARCDRVVAAVFRRIATRGKTSE